MKHCRVNERANMLLIRFTVWFGPSRDRDPSLPEMPVTVTQEAYATRLSLLDAIRHVRAYEDAVKARYAKVTATELTLLGVDAIDDLDDEALDLARVRLIESLPTEADKVGL